MSGRNCMWIAALEKCLHEYLFPPLCVYTVFYFDSALWVCLFICPDDPDYTCGGHVHTHWFSFLCQSVSPSLPLSTHTSQICEWHVSLHLARTCIGYAHCIMASGLSNAALQRYYNTWEVTRNRETNCLCKSIKTTKQLQLHLLPLWKKIESKGISLKNESLSVFFHVRAEPF